MTSLHHLFLLGRPLGPLYGLAMRLRAALYSADVFTRQSMPVAVISVGNLVLGGSGKTPMVRYLAELLLAMGLRPAIVSRGYGGTMREQAAVVSDGRSLLLSPQQGGDEPAMLARALPQVPVVIGRRRLHPCRLAIDRLNANVLILDDGFQHLAVRRNLDLVLFDGSTLAGDGRVFPAGILREPMSALCRADAVVLTGITASNREGAEDFAALVRRRHPALPVFFVSLARPSLRFESGAPPQSGPFFAFCGIANPERFSDTVRSMGLIPSGTLKLPDHVRYSPELLAEICTRATDCGATWLLTTAKDAVKLHDLPRSLPLGIIEIALASTPQFDLFLGQRLQDISGTAH